MTVEADSKRPIPEERILLWFDVQIGQRLIPADVHGADDADLAAALFDRLPIRLELLLLRWNRRRTHKDEL